MGLGLGGSFFWDPNTSAQGAYDYGTSDWGTQMLEASPQTAFYRFGRQMGVPDNQNTAFARWFAQQYPQWQQGYNAYTISNPLTADVNNYNATLGGYEDWRKRFMSAPQQIRGEDPSNRGAGPVRWTRWG